MNINKTSQPKLLNCLLFFSFIFLSFSCNSDGNRNESSERTKTNINENWLYLENDTESISDALNMQNWQKINLPHSWNSLDATDLNPGYRRSGSWYKKNIEISLS